MKKTIKLFGSLAIIAALMASAFMFSACGGGANNPERAARNLINAISSQNASRLADVFNLEGETRDTWIASFEEDNQEPNRNTQPDAHTQFRHRQREFSSLSLENFTSRAVTAADTSITATVTFSFRYINNRGDRVEGTRIVSLSFNRGASSRWYSAQSNLDAVVDAMRSERT